MAKPAPACKKALADATARWPGRNRLSDGIMGDAAHAARKSDHNDGNAFDLTNDVMNGPHCEVLKDGVIKDPRVTYVIWSGKIFKRYKPELGWAKYTGPNPHNHHMHVSIKPESRDDLSPWVWSPKETHPVAEAARPVLRLTIPPMLGPDVRLLKEKLKAKGYLVVVEGVFDGVTDTAVRKFQADKDLKVDGRAGSETWKALG